MKCRSSGVVYGLLGLFLQVGRAVYRHHQELARLAFATGGRGESCPLLYLFLLLLGMRSGRLVASGTCDRSTRTSWGAVCG